MNRQSQRRCSKKFVRSANRGSRSTSERREGVGRAAACTCEALERRALLSAVVAPHFGVETFLQDNHSRLTNPGIVLIFWGSYWGGANTALAQTIRNATINVCTSPYLQET